MRSNGTCKHKVATLAKEIRHSRKVMGGVHEGKALAFGRDVKRDGKHDHY
jgi:hypothetical protein